MPLSMRFIAIVAATTLIGLAPALAARHHVRHHHRSHETRSRHSIHRPHYAGGGYRRPYASSVSPTITCYYADGTPYDPDVIGGPNHVGDGGPAVNLGGFDPCAY